jgi:hypothetical protein
MGWWETTVQTMRTFAQRRPQYVGNHINKQFVLAGIFDLTVSVIPAFAGNVKHNTIEVGGDLWQGKYFQNVPITLTANPRNGYNFNYWDVEGVVFFDNSIEINLAKATKVKVIYVEVVNEGNSVVINEINYNSPAESDAGDWMEIFNWGSVDLDISGWVLKDDDYTHQFKMPENSILKSNDYFVICREKADFNTIHSNVINIVGDLDFGLGSSSDVLRLFDSSNRLVDSLAYASKSPWPTEPNGFGPTLELNNFCNDNSKPEFWKSSLENFGTPGRINSITTGNELLTKNISNKHLKIYPNPFTTETRIKIENNAVKR